MSAHTNRKSYVSMDKKYLASRFNLTYMYIYIDVVFFFIINEEFVNYLSKMYRDAPEIKDTKMS